MDHSYIDSLKKCMSLASRSPHISLTDTMNSARVALGSDRDRWYTMLHAVANGLGVPVERNKSFVISICLAALWEEKGVFKKEYELNDLNFPKAVHSCMDKALRSSVNENTAFCTGVYSYARMLILALEKAYFAFDLTEDKSKEVEPRKDEVHFVVDDFVKNGIAKILSIIEEKQKAKPPIFTSANNHYLEWEGLAFRHSTEIELAKELDRRGVTFFPSAGVRITNQLTEERKTLEPDFLVCHDGKWGIIELDGDSHKEKHYSDAQRARIFKKQGISIVESYPSTMPPEKIVDDFLEILRMS